MKIWHWTEAGLQQAAQVRFSQEKPVVIICGGGFNVDDPSQSLREYDQAVDRFFDFIITHVGTDKENFKRLICGDVTGKLELNYFLIRKLLGLISAVPGEASYPSTMKEGFSDSVDIFEITYSSTASCFRDTQALYVSTEYSSADALACAEAIFSPLLAQYAQDDISKLCKKLRQITLFGISHGSNFLLELENAFTVLLERAGYAPQDRKTILAEVFSLAISSIAPFTKATGSRFTSIYFEGINDKLAQWINPYKTPAQSEGLSVIPVAENRLLLLSSVVQTANEWIEILPEFDYFWINNDKAAHYTPFYTMRCMPENIQPELIERVLRNAVQRYRKPLDSLQQLFLKAAPLSSQVAPFDASESVNRQLRAAGYG